RKGRRSDWLPLSCQSRPGLLACLVSYRRLKNVQQTPFDAAVVFEIRATRAPFSCRNASYLHERAIQWGDTDFNGRFVTVHRNIVRGVVISPKSHQRRRVDLSPQLVKSPIQWRRVQRARWLKKGKSMPPWVFPSLERTPLEERKRTACAHANVR